MKCCQSLKSPLSKEFNKKAYEAAYEILVFNTLLSNEGSGNTVQIQRFPALILEVRGRWVDCLTQDQGVKGSSFSSVKPQ